MRDHRMDLFKCIAICSAVFLQITSGLWDCPITVLLLMIAVLKWPEVRQRPVSRRMCRYGSSLFIAAAYLR